MAVCEFCQNEMQAHHSCLWQTVRIKRQVYPRLRYGEETRYGSRQPGYWRDYGAFCPDCAVEGLHHAGCEASIKLKATMLKPCHCINAH